MDSSQEQILRELEARKKVLREELNQLEDTLGNRMQVIQEDVSGRVQPAWWIRKYPLQSVGIAIAAGLILGYREKTSSVHSSGGITVTASVIAALKAYAARKAVERIVDFVENTDK